MAAFPFHRHMSSMRECGAVMGKTWSFLAGDGDGDGQEKDREEEE